jgi:hypothetical protein
LTDGNSGICEYEDQDLLQRKTGKILLASSYHFSNASVDLGDTVEVNSALEDQSTVAKYRFETFLPLEGQVKLAHLIKAEILRQMAI